MKILKNCLNMEIITECWCMLLVIRWELYTYNLFEFFCTSGRRLSLHLFWPTEPEFQKFSLAGHFLENLQFLVLNFYFKEELAVLKMKFSSSGSKYIHTPLFRYIISQMKKTYLALLVTESSFPLISSYCLLWCISTENITK